MSETEGLIPMFYVNAVQNKAESAEAGRPVFKEQERIKIMFVGDRSQEIDRKASDEDRERFHDAYEKFKRKQEQVAEGTPIEQWPVLNVTQVAELKHHNIFTVEHLAQLNDQGLSKVSGLRELQKRAKVFLETLAPDAALADKMAALEKDNEKLKEQVAALMAEIESADDKPVKVKKTKAA